MLGTRICGQRDEEMESTGGQELRIQKRIDGDEGIEPGVNRVSRIKGAGGSS